MFFVIVILGFVAVAMAKKAPNTAGESLPPDTSLPATGATDKFSPALTGGSGLIAQDNRVRLGMRYRNAPNLLPRTKLRPIPMKSLPGIMGGLTDAQSSLKTQDVPPLVTQVTDYTPGMLSRRVKL
jgi:hypothetical protein